MNKDLPCRVTADLNRHESLLNAAENQAFDEWDDAIMHDVMGNERLAKTAQALLIALAQIDMTKDSFGLDAERTVKFLVPLLKDFRKAIVEEWRDQ